MKVQLIVVQGKPEGKVIPLAGPKFKIGRGETCHLRPNSEQVSREHAEFSIGADDVSVRDLGSRNGTLVNGKAITEPYQLKDQDLVQVGPLTFAVSIQGAPAASKPEVAAPAAKSAPEDVSHDEIESWLIADSKSPAPERPSGVYPGDTITITAFKDASAAKPAAARPAPASAPSSATDDSDDEYERLPEGEGDEEEVNAEAVTEEMPEDLIDESNPFYVKKKAPESGPVKPQYKDTSDAASDILRKMMERRRSSH
jgi:pSer/pThr/pTyr-binding forkhead associated (FHA) protein